MTVERFEITVPDADLAELRERLARTRFADVPALPDWGAGVPGDVLRDWVAAWADHDWRAAESDLNGFEHYRATVDGQPIHFIHRRGTGPDPVPLILTHGWPWTFWDWHATIDALADPGAYGGDPADAFDVVVASVPGATFSTPLRVAPLGYTETADLWVNWGTPTPSTSSASICSVSSRWTCSATALPSHEPWTTEGSGRTRRRPTRCWRRRHSYAGVPAHHTSSCIRWNPTPSARGCKTRPLG
jgi:Epoxide hydrolase N terminus